MKRQGLWVATSLSHHDVYSRSQIPPLRLLRHCLAGSVRRRCVLCLAASRSKLSHPGWSLKKPGLSGPASRLPHSLQPPPPPRGPGPSSLARLALQLAIGAAEHSKRQSLACHASAPADLFDRVSCLTLRARCPNANRWHFGPAGVCVSLSPGVVRTALMPAILPCQET